MVDCVDIIRYVSFDDEGLLCCGKGRVCSRKDRALLIRIIRIEEVVGGGVPLSVVRLLGYVVGRDKCDL